MELRPCPIAGLFYSPTRNVAQCFVSTELSSTYTDKNSPSPRLQKTFLNWNLFLTIFFKRKRTLTNCQSHPKGDRTDYFRKEQLGLSFWSMIIRKSGHSDCFFFEKKVGASSILTWVQADTASAACPAHTGSFATTSMTFPIN